jgi:DNA polymerase-3 subunit epsilon
MNSSSSSRKRYTFSGFSSAAISDISNNFASQQPVHTPENTKKSRRRILPQFGPNGWYIPATPPTPQPPPPPKVEAQITNDEDLLLGIDVDALFDIPIQFDGKTSNQSEEVKTERSQTVSPSALNVFFHQLSSKFDNSMIVPVQTPLPDWNQRVIVMDTETTGFSMSDQVIEVCCVELVNGVLTGRQYHSYIYEPGMPRCHPEAFKVHGITEQQLRDFGSPKDLVFPWLMEFIGDSCVIAYNAKFDVRCLKQTFLLFEKFYNDARTVCLMEVFASIRKFGSSVPLDQALRLVGLPARSKTNHSAIEDSLLTAHLFQALWKETLQNLVQDT